MEKLGMSLLGLAAAFALFALTACTAPATPTISLNPSVTVNSVNIGQGKPVALQVIDGRPTQGYGAAKFDPNQNIQEIFTREINKGLSRDGFVVDPSSPAQLTVKLLAIDYRQLTGIASMNTETFVSADVIAKTPAGTYHKTYNASAYNDNYLRAAKQDPSTQVNLAVSKLLNNILNDGMLMQFLASR